MTWLLFMDESGHDHRSMPYEVRGGIAIHAAKLWAFTRHIQQLERRYFGATRHDLGTEIKGDKLLKRSRFKYANHDQPLRFRDRRSLTLGFLKSTAQNKPPRRGELRAYCETCLAFAHAILESLELFNICVFGSFIPSDKPPKGIPAPEDYLRKDHVFLLERFFYFLEAHNETGLLVMDGTEKTQDRRFVKGLERYFLLTSTGKQRAERIAPVPFFVESDMGYGVQVADLCIYCLNNAYRVPGIALDGVVRDELVPYVAKLRPHIDRRQVEVNGQTHHLHSVIYVPDPYTTRKK
ncbi:MAG: DUF3800 domain-containing protein [Phycisphaerales bacterium JB047]